jgi:hypothetical protein
MRSRTCFVVLAVLLALSACHASGNFTQTYENQNDSSQLLTLKSKTGIIRPNAGFPHNLFFKLFAGDLKGDYELKKGGETVKGTFAAVKEGEKQFIKFTPGEGASDKTEWKVQLKLGGMLADGDTVWAMKSTAGMFDAASQVKIGGN